MDYQYINKMTDYQSKQNQLINLEQSLQSLKDRYTQETIYSENTLQQLKTSALSHHFPYKHFKFVDIRELIQTVYEKTLKGWTYSFSNQLVYYPSLGGCAGHVYLTKPDDLISSEIVEIESKVTEDYLAEIESLKSKLTTEIVELTIQIEDLKKQISDESKKEANYAKVLKQVEKDLIAQSTVASEEESEIVLTKPNKNFDAQGTAIDNNGEVISNE